MRKKTTLFLLLLLLLGSINSIAQSRVVTGKVTSTEDLTSLPGVSVLIKGSKNGVSTDDSGYYRVSVPNNQTTLVFTGVGYAKREIKIGSLSQLNISLTSDGSSLNEVVVTALGISRNKKALTYASQGVASKEINENLQPNVVNALQGKVAGVTISSVGGGPGQGATIRVRGINSIDVTQSNDPLFVIDGVIIDNSTSTVGAGSS